MTLVSRQGRKILGYDIALDKSTERIQDIADNAPKVDEYHSDGYKAYKEIYYHGNKHQAHYDKIKAKHIQ